MSIQQAFPPAKLVFAGVGILLLVSHLVYSRVVKALELLNSVRRLKTMLRAKTSLSTSSGALKVS